MRKGYLIDLPDKESEAIRRFIELQFISERLLGSLGLNCYFSWYILQLRTYRIVRQDCLVKSKPGDVDILVGSLSWKDPQKFKSILKEEDTTTPTPSIHHYFEALKLAESGGINWPPLMNYIVAIEAKCAYLHPQAGEISEKNIKSKKSSPQKVRNIRDQIKGLINIGLDNVTLLDIIANPPASVAYSHAWNEASNIAISSMDAIMPILRKRLPESSPAGHWVWPIGSVMGDDEINRGATSIIELKKAQDNPLLSIKSSTQSCRHELENNLYKILAKLPPPCKFPVCFLDCRKCNMIHSLEETCKNSKYNINRL